MEDDDNQEELDLEVPWRQKERMAGRRMFLRLSTSFVTV